MKLTKHTIVTLIEEVINESWPGKRGFDLDYYLGNMDKKGRARRRKGTGLTPAQSRLPTIKDLEKNPEALKKAAYMHGARGKPLPLRYKDHPDDSNVKLAYADGMKATSEWERKNYEDKGVKVFQLTSGRWAPEEDALQLSDGTWVDAYDDVFAPSIRSGGIPPEIADKLPRGWKHPYDEDGFHRQRLPNAKKGPYKFGTWNKIRHALGFEE